MDTKGIHIKDYDYPLPDERIAKYPLPERDRCKLLVYDKGRVSEDTFRHLPSLLPPGALMVFNDTRVIQARLRFRKAVTADAAPGGEGALIEVFLLEPALPAEYQENFCARGRCAWYCMVGNLKKWKGGSLVRTVSVRGADIRLTATREGERGASQRVVFQWDGPLTWAELLEAAGELPIPPYLNRPTEEGDKTAYQTVYSRVKGSVAAPTAGLHFTRRVMDELATRGIELDDVTLHVGAGTFKPVKTAEIGGHDMHAEHIAVSRGTVARLLAHGGSAIAVGTTSVRTLESLYYMGLTAKRLMDGGRDTGDGEELRVEQWAPYERAEGDARPTTMEALEALRTYLDRNDLAELHSTTRIIIAPGYEYHIVRMMITNFHQPQSTLLLLVSAFVGGDWRKIYDYALARGFRFLSYGDSSLLIP